MAAMIGEVGVSMDVHNAATAPKESSDNTCCDNPAGHTFEGMDTLLQVLILLDALVLSFVWPMSTQYPRETLMDPDPSVNPTPQPQPPTPNFEVGPCLWSLPRLVTALPRWHGWERHQGLCCVAGGQSEAATVFQLGETGDLSYYAWRPRGAGQRPGWEPEALLP